MATTFESTLHGTLLMCSAYTQRDPVSGKPIYTHLRIIAKQPNGMLFEAVQVVGIGPDAVTRAALLKGRLQAGTEIEAHGCGVTITRSRPEDPPRLFLQNVEYIRTTAAPSRAPSNVHSILTRLAERVPAVARGMQANHF
jgi:hypothetical protein